MFTFIPWGAFRAFRNKRVTTAFLKDVAKTSYDILRQGILNPPKTGRIYRRKRGMHQASVNISEAEYPANETGALYRSADWTATANKAEIGTDMYYSKYLREGTKRMERRKMSDNAMKEGIDKARGRLGHWAEWKRG